MQKFMVKLSAVVIISGLYGSLAFAGGHKVKITINCPKINVKGDERVINYGSYTAGRGSERVNSDVATRPLFQGPTVPGADIPTDLEINGYQNHGVEYNPAKGSVTCFYTSCMGFQEFSISYLMENAFNGTTADSGAEEIHIKLPIGLTENR